jgi:hypothetical protein
MAEGQKRFPWWLVACAALLVPPAAVIGFIETVGRQGTTVGRCQRLELGMAEFDALALVGRPADWNFNSPDFGDGACSMWYDGPMDVTVYWTKGEQPERGIRSIQFDRSQRGPDPFWHMRRWAEQAYTAIHGPRR